MNRTGRRDKKQLEQYQKAITELSKLKQDYKDLTHQCAESDDKNHKLIEENTKLADLVNTLATEVSKLQVENDRLQKELKKVETHNQALAKSVIVLSQPAEAAEAQGETELKTDHLCSPSTGDAGVCACGKALPILDLSKVS